MSAARRSALASALAVAIVLSAGCNELAGIRMAVLDPCVFAVDSCEDTGGAGGADGAGGAGGADFATGPTTTAIPSTNVSTSANTGAATSGSASTSAATSVSASASTSAGSGICGDGIVSAGEECDDRNNTPDDGCTACVVDCSGPGTFKDPARHHCYRLISNKIKFVQALASCTSKGEHLAAITTSAELMFVMSHIGEETEAWIGGNDSVKEGTFVWTDGEPWGYAPWVPGAPSKNPSSDCVMLDAEQDGFNDEDCNKKFAALCERGAAGVSP